MAESGQEPRLAQELPLGFGAEVEILLEGDVQMERFVEGQVDGAHPALAELALDAVAVIENRAGLEGHDADSKPVPRAGQSGQ